MAAIYDDECLRPDGSHKALPLLWLAIAALTSAFALGVWSAGDNVHAWDRAIACRVQGWHGDIPTRLQQLGDISGDTLAAILVLGTFAAITLAAGWRCDARFVLMAAALRLLGPLLKRTFNSPRPTDDIVRLIEHYDTMGYPSGHSMTATTIATVAMVLVWRHSERSAVRIGVSMIAVLFVLLVGWSRVWAGAHWPSDVIGGWCFGVGFTLLAATLSDGHYPEGTQARRSVP